VQKDSYLPGTSYWMAPEIIRQQPHNQRVDSWSLGITLYEIIEGGPPYASLPPMRVSFQ
jgi:serine/threonine-protein kinase 24/25/MST4